jgi:hypothetical protein
MTDFAEPEVRVFDARRSAHDRKFTEGRDGWLFLDHDDNHVMAQHRGELLLSADQLTCWFDALERRAAFMEARGGQDLFLLAPDAHAVYPEKLPATVTPAAVRPVLQLLDHLEANGSRAHVLYPLADLLRAKEKGLVYAQTDTHWNAHGAFLVYDLIASALEKAAPLRHVGRDDIDIIERVGAGDLGLKANPERESPQAYFAARHRASRRQWDNGIRGLGRTIAFACPEAPDTTCVMFGDSAAARMSTLMAETFRKFVLHYSPDADAEIVDREGAGVMMSLLTERRIVNAPRHDRGFPAA